MGYDEWLERKHHPENFEPALEDFESVEDMSEALEELDYIQECEAECYQDFAII